MNGTLNESTYKRMGDGDICISLSRLGHKDRKDAIEIIKHCQPKLKKRVPKTVRIKFFAKDEDGMIREWHQEFSEQRFETLKRTDPQDLPKGVIGWVRDD
jgi:hypothetical protein